MLTRRLILGLPMLGFGGCLATAQKVDFPVLPTADLVEVLVASRQFSLEHGSYRLERRIEDGATCGKITAFVNERRRGFATPWAGAPIPVLRLNLRRGDQLLSAVGVGRNFLQRATFETLSIPQADIGALLDLIGLDESALERP